MVKIKNYCKYIRTQQIIDIIKLLPNEYQNLNIKIIMISKYTQLLRYLYLHNIYHILNVVLFKRKYVLRGTSGYKDKNIFILTNNFDLNSEFSTIQKIKCIHTLIHEIRHQYQRQRMKKEFLAYNLNKKYNKITSYECLWQEKDARKFSSEFMNNKSNEIFEIINN